MTVTFFGTYDTTTTPRIQAMIDGLRTHDVSVSECNVPLKFDTASRVKLVRQPWRLPGLLLRVGLCWLRLIRLSRRDPAFGEADAIVVGHLGHLDVHLARWLFRRKPIALDYMISASGTAQDRQLSGGLKNRMLSWLDNSALKTADIIILDTEARLLSLPEKFRQKAVVVPVGAPADWFDAAKQPAASSAETPLSVIFFGTYSPLQGAPTIGAAVARLKTPVKLTMVGSGQDLAATRQAMANHPNVEVKWIDWVAAADLPKLVAEHDVCLGIFGTTTKAQSVVPNKVYQGAAVGCAIVTANTTPQRQVFGDAALFVPAGDAEALARALDNMAQEPAELHKLRVAAYNLARTSFTPQQVVMPLLAKLEQT